MRLLFLLTFLLPQLSSAQQYFRLKGEVANPTENKIVVSLYKNWVEEPEDYSLFLDANNRFSFQVALDDIAYLDINYGLNGVLFQIIEPDDDIYLKFNTDDFYESFHPTGKGSGKWIYYLNQRKNFEISKDVDREAAAAIKLGQSAYFQKIEALELEQISFLESYAKLVSGPFMKIRKADILGRMNQYRLDYLMSKGELGGIFNHFFLRIVDPKTQDKSFEYGFFVESLVAAYQQSVNSVQLESNFQEYSLVKYCFDKDWIGKSITERILAAKLNGFLDFDGFSNENQSIVKDYLEFSQNSEYNRFLKAKLSTLKGRELGDPAPEFVLSDIEDKYFSLRDLKGSYVLLVFWASWCDPCLKDLKSLPIVDSYFKSKKQKLEVISLAIDRPEDFATVVSKCKASGRCVRLDPNSDFLERYGVSSIPSYLLIDAEGNWAEDKLLEPALDEGRGLIKQLEDIFDQ